ncbi:MAG: hypothetical protein NTW69_09805 [Chloroflexi bacterium]|nr:hypothetical protein [Chloroflexota bacterium]
MKNKYSSSKNKLTIKLYLFGLITLLGLYGCAPPTQMVPQLEQNATAAPCSLESPGINIYNITPRSLTQIIFNKAYSNPATGQTDVNLINFIDLDIAKYAAFQDLIRETQRWSDVETIVLSETNVVKITVTFISPELIDSVVLNQVLQVSEITGGFDGYLLNTRQSFAARGELLFLITLTATNVTDINIISHNLIMPISQMVLTNSSDVTSPPNHDDHNLELPMNSSSEFAFGFISYPLAGVNGNGCNWLLDPTYNTNIVLSIPHITVDNVSNGPYSWKFSYAPPLIGILPELIPNYNRPPDFTNGRITPTLLPPRLTTNLSFPNGEEPEVYWEGFARYVWHQLIGEPY